MPEACEQVAEQLDFQFVARSEIAVPAFAGENVLALPVPDQTGLSQPRSRRDHSLIASRGLRMDLIESDRVGRFQALDSPGLRLEIVDDADRAQLQFPGEARRFDNPGEIRGFDASVPHRPCDSETGDGRTSPGFGYKFEYDFIQSAEFPARKDVFMDGNKTAGSLRWIPSIVAEAGGGSPHVSGENHCSKFLQRRPSRSMSSSDSFGPQVPAG